MSCHRSLGSPTTPLHRSPDSSRPRPPERKHHCRAKPKSALTKIYCAKRRGQQLNRAGWAEETLTKYSGNVSSVARIAHAPPSQAARLLSPPAREETPPPPTEGGRSRSAMRMLRIFMPGQFAAGLQRCDSQSTASQRCNGGSAASPRCNGKSAALKRGGKQKDQLRMDGRGGGVN